jgi:hypothetical protein
MKRARRDDRGADVTTSRRDPEPTARAPRKRARREGRAPRFVPPPPGAAPPMRLWPHVVRALLAMIFFALDALFVRLAVEVNAAGALLSPGGAVSLEALVVASLFALTRLAFVTTLALTAGLLAAALVDRLVARVLATIRRSDVG